MEGIQNAIDTFNAETGGDLRSFEELFKDWVLAIYADDEDSDLFNFIGVDFGIRTRAPGRSSWPTTSSSRTAARTRAPSPARCQNDPHVPQQTALPYGTSYETFRNPGGTFEVDARRR